MSGVILIQHASSQVRDILASIALSGDINLVALHAEGLDETFPEIVELVRNINFILDGRRTGREASTGRLINVHDVGQVSPRIRVTNGLVLARLPQERAILLEKTIERTTSGTTIQPDGNLNGQSANSFQ